jgi:hypothetical protein
MKHLQLFESFNSGVYIYSETFNGDGYSDPTLGVCKEGEIIDVFKKFSEHYTDGEWTKNVNHTDGYKLDVSFVDHDEEDAGRIIFNSVEPNKYYLVLVTPDVNETFIDDPHDTLEEALDELDQIVHNEDYDFDEDDVDEYDGGLSFGSHNNDTGYEHYEIIKT